MTVRSTNTPPTSLKHFRSGSSARASSSVVSTKLGEVLAVRDSRASLFCSLVLLSLLLKLSNLACKRLQLVLQTIILLLQLWLATGEIRLAATRRVGETDPAQTAWAEVPCQWTLLSRLHSTWRRRQMRAVTACHAAVTTISSKKGANRIADARVVIGRGECRQCPAALDGVEVSRKSPAILHNVDERSFVVVHALVDNPHHHVLRARPRRRRSLCQAGRWPCHRLPHHPCLPMALHWSPRPSLEQPAQDPP